MTTTLDTLLGGRVRIFQPEAGYRVAIDPILLAAAVNAPECARILDAGCGTGAALFCVLTRFETANGVGLERQPDLAVLAQQGAVSNQLDNRARIIAGDLAAPPEDMAGPFDVVMTNPPYFEAGTIPPCPNKAQENAESDLPLAQWIEACFKVLRQDGLFAIVHRAERLDDIIANLHGRSGAVTVVPLWPKAGSPAKRVIITARKGRRSPTLVHPGLVLHEENGDFTPAADAILRDGAALDTTA